MINYLTERIPKDIIYIENIVPESFRKTILEFSESEDFPWFFAKSIVKDVDDEYGFAHSLFIEKENSEFYKIYSPIFYFLENKTGFFPKKLIRLRLRMTLPVKNNTSYTNIAHIDHEFPHTVMVYYVNDADGETVLYDKLFGEDKNEMSEIARIQPKSGSAIIFNGLRFHSGASPSEKRRIVLNANFI